MRPRHLSDGELTDVLEGAGDARARAHVAACSACGSRLEAASRGMALARQADVPEPPAPYWGAFRRRVGERIGDEAARGWGPRLLPILAAVAALLVIVPALRTTAPPSSHPVLPAWSALPPAEEDEGLAVLRDLALAEAELPTGRELGGIAQDLADLTEEESRALAEALRRGIEGGEL
jgi:hypothetical protein